MFDRGKSASVIPATPGRHGARRLVAVGLLVVLLFGALAGAMSGTKTGVSTLKAGPASTLATVAFTLAAVVTVAMLAATIWGLLVKARDDPDSPNRRRSTMFQRIAAGAIVGLCVGIGVLASRLVKHPRPVRVPGLVANRGASPTVGHSSLYFSRGAAAGTLGVVLATVLCVLIVSQIGAVRRRLPWSLGHLLYDAPRARTPGQADPVELADTLAAVRIPDPDGEADPRKAVVAAYVAMNHAAADAGARRRLDETPAEYLERLLESLGATSEAARRLTSCFESARYSTKTVDETLRSSAIEALRQIRAELDTARERAGSARAMVPATT